MGCSEAIKDCSSGGCPPGRTEMGSPRRRGGCPRPSPRPSPDLGVRARPPWGLLVFLGVSTLRAPFGQSDNNQRRVCFNDYRRWGHTNMESWGLAFEKFKIQKSGWVGWGGCVPARNAEQSGEDEPETTRGRGLLRIFCVVDF